MPLNIAYYRTKARRCSDYAASTASDDARRFFQTASKVWLQLADDREHELATWRNLRPRAPDADDLDSWVDSAVSVTYLCAHDLRRTSRVS
jgi:hypothetical protein